MSENSDLQFIEYPSLLRRFACINYDLLLLLAVSIAYGMIYIGIAKWVFSAESDGAKGIVFQLGWLLTLVGFYAYFWIKGGQTTGMRAWRLKITDLNMQTPSLKQTVTRFFLAPLGWLLFFTAFLDNKKQFLHDKLSGTQLILLPKEAKKNIK